MSRTSELLLWDEGKEAALQAAFANVQPSIDGLLANAEHLNQVQLGLTWVGLDFVLGWVSWVRLGWVGVVWFAKFIRHAHVIAGCPW